MTMRWLSSRWKTLWIAACALGVGGFGLRYLEVHDFDLAASAGPGDPRLLGLAAIGLLLLAFVLWAAAMRREISGAAFFLGTLGGSALLIWPGILPPMLAGTQLGTAGLLVCSLAHLAGTARCRRFSAAWWGAQAVGLLNVLTNAAGIASPLAVIVGTLASRSARKTPVPWSLLGANALLIAVALARGFAHPGSGAAGMDAAVFRPLFAWPWSGLTLALIAAGPSVYLLSQGRDREDGSAGAPTVRLFCWWILLQILLVASGPFRPGSTWPSALFVFALMIHFCALAVILSGRHRPWIKVAVGTLWMVGLVNTSLQPGPSGPGDELAPGPGTPAALAPVRAPLALKPLPRESAGFASEGAPPLDGKPPGLPTWGNWAPGGSIREGRWVSEPISSSAPLLRIYLAGTLRPPATSLILRTADGREFAPLQPRAETPQRWKEFHFNNPGSAFQVVARVASPDLWLAFSAPVEVSRLTWLSGKLIAAWPWLIGWGLALGCCGCVGSLSAWRRERAGPEPRWAAGEMTWVLWLAFFAYSFFLAHFVDHYAAGSDAAGYLNSAKLLLQGRLTFPPRIIPGLAIATDFYAPLGLNVVRGAIVPGYPPGLPLMLAGLGHLGSLESAIPVVILAHLMLGVFFTERLAGVCGLPRPWSYLAAVMIAVCPLYVCQGLQTMSDGPSLVWVTGALYFALASRQRASLAVWAGLATAIAVLLRPANVICILPVLLALGLSPKRLAALALGGLPGALFCAWYDYRLYGSPFQTAYGDVRSLFDSRWLGPTFGSYARWFTVYFTPVVWLAFAGVRGRALTRQAQISVAALVVAYLVFYGFYCYTHETWWYLRFVLPAFPGLAVLSTAGVKQLVDLKPDHAAERSLVVLAALGALLLGNAVWRCSELPILDQWHGDQVYQRAARWIEDHTPANAVVLCFQTSGALAFYTEHPLIRSDASDTAQLAPMVGELLRRKTPLYALVFRFDSMPALDRLPGRWEKSAEIGFAAVWKGSPSR